MLLFVACLLPLMTSALLDSQTIIKTPTLIVDVRNGIQTDVRFVGCLNINHTVVDLSNFSLRGLEKTAFNNVLDVELLILANNSLTSLPEFAFSNLSSLRTLSLSGNQLSEINNLFVGLKNLQLLDISRNPIKSLWQGELFGLTKSVKILTNENKFRMISTGMFAKPVKYLNWYRLETLEQEKNFGEISEEEVKRKKEVCVEERNVDRLFVNSQEIVINHNNNTRIKICKLDGIVTTLAIIEKDEKLVEGCVQVFANAIKMDIRKQDIRGFQENWYQLLDSYILLDLSSNNITEIAIETLNSLTNLWMVKLLGNKIRKIRSQVIKNYYLKTIYLNNNLIDDIEENAFTRTRLWDLYLGSNQLKSLNFVSSLPDTLMHFDASRNYITSIPNGVFSKLDHLSTLNLEYNEIRTLQTDVFLGLKDLFNLNLRGNNIMTIEASAFRDLSFLHTINLQCNSLRELPKNTFAEVKTVWKLDLSNNNITKAMFNELPFVNSLFLDYNDIEVLEEGNFVQVPKGILSLTGNRITKIKRGAFNLPTLTRLYLDKNLLTTIEGDSYEGLSRLEHLSLSENKISDIRKSACINLGSLHLLDISKNPFEKLENSALHGLNTDFRTRLYIRENNLKEIQGGVFDDI